MGREFRSNVKRLGIWGNDLHVGAAAPPSTDQRFGGIFVGGLAALTLAVSVISTVYRHKGLDKMPGGGMKSAALTTLGRHSHSGNKAAAPAKVTTAAPTGALSRVAVDAQTK